MIAAVEAVCPIGAFEVGTEVALPDGRILTKRIGWSKQTGVSFAKMKEHSVCVCVCVCMRVRVCVCVCVCLCKRKW